MWPTDEARLTGLAFEEIKHHDLGVLQTKLPVDQFLYPERGFHSGGVSLFDDEGNVDDPAALDRVDLKLRCFTDFDAAIRRYEKCVRSQRIEQVLKMIVVKMLERSPEAFRTGGQNDLKTQPSFTDRVGSSAEGP